LYEKITIAFSVLIILGVAAAIFFIINNSELKKEVTILKFENSELKQGVAILESEKIILEQKKQQILEKAGDYLISEGRTIIPDSGVSCPDKIEECLDYWINKLTSGSRQDSPCDFANNEVGCGRNDFKILSPNGGESLCTGDEVIISWVAPSDAESVTIKLRESGIFGETYNVGTFPASFNEGGKKNGQGTIIWKVPQHIKDSLVYKLWINTVYKGFSINDNSDDLFTIQTCKG
jgi:hypothetical protein